MAEQFCLRWNNFQSNIVSALESLKASEDLVDVTLTCQGKSIKAHKVILSACSPYFRSVFKDNPCQHPIIILKDVLAEDILNLLSYMYQGEVFIEESKLPSFLHTAALLQVKGLSGDANQEENELLANPWSRPLGPNRCGHITISSKSPSRLITAGAVKRRRNSATDRFSDSAFSDHTKKYKSLAEQTDTFPSVLAEPILSESCDSGETGKSTLPSDRTTDVNIKTEPDLQPVAIKRELEEATPRAAEEEIENNTVRNPSEDEQGIDVPLPIPHPQYENSMLARSLLSGVAVKQERWDMRERDRQCPAHQPAVCPHCGKYFTRDANLRRHLHSVRPRRLKGAPAVAACPALLAEPFAVAAHPALYGDPLAVAAHSAPSAELLADAASLARPTEPLAVAAHPALPAEPFAVAASPALSAEPLALASQENLRLDT